jgi:hypothetical protein
MQTKADKSAVCVLTFQYSVSKGINTYGYNIVTLYADDKKVARVNGGGYDMRGTCLGEYIKANYIDRLKTLKGNHGSGDDGTGYYGLTFYKTDHGKYEYSKEYQERYNISLDGACGENCMVGIANAIGLDMMSKKIGNDWGYIVFDNLSNK